MKRTFLPLLLVFVLLTGCSSEPDGKINMPSSSRDFEGSNYLEVIAELEGVGFTNVETEILADMVIGWLTEDGEVEEVSVDGNTTFSTDSKYSADVKIVVSYHTFPEEDAPIENSEPTQSPEPPIENPEELENITVDNSEQLATVLAVKDELDPVIAEFNEANKGKVIEFDGCITLVSNYEDYDTRYDILLSAGDYVDETTANPGPLFKFEDVNVYDLGINDLYLPEFVSAGRNIHITAKILDYDNNTGLFMLNPVSVTER